MKVFVILCSIALAGAMPTAMENGVLEKFTSSLRECLATDTTLCLKEKVLKYTDNLALSKDLTVADGITFSRTGSPRSARSYEPLSEEPKEREVQIEDRILDNVVDFFDSHVLQLRMPKIYEEEDNSVDGEGRGKKKKKLKKLLPIFALLKFKLLALIPLFLGIIAFSLFKGLILGKMAFMATAFSTLRKLMDNKKVGTSGWAETSQVDHGWDNTAGWGRSQNGQDLAYSHVKQD